jgi:hypothetical protein
MPRYIVLIVLVFSVICAKQILILNEEIVVALSFIGFVLYVETSFGDTIRESIDSRGATILEELQHHMTLQQMNLQSAIREQQFIADELQSSTEQIGDAVSNEIKINLPELYQSLQFALGQQIVTQLNILVNFQKNYRNALQLSLVTGFKEAAQIQYSYSKGRKAQPIQLKQCFVLLNRYKQNQN